MNEENIKILLEIGVSPQVISDMCRELIFNCEKYTNEENIDTLLSDSLTIDEMIALKSYVKI